MAARTCWERVPNKVFPDLESELELSKVTVPGGSVASLWLKVSPTLRRVLSRENIVFSLCEYTRILTVSSETLLLQYSPFRDVSATIILNSENVS